MPLISRMPKRGTTRKIKSRVFTDAFTISVAKFRSFPSSMLKTAGWRLRRLCRRIRCAHRRFHRNKITIRGFTSRFKSKPAESVGKESLINPAVPAFPELPTRPIRIATFNASMFSMAPAASTPSEHDLRCKSVNHRPRSILKQLPSLTKPKLKVSINLPDNEIERKSKGLNFRASSKRESSGRSVLDVLREVGADIIGLQNVKAEEENEMRPLSDLAAGLGMKYVFAESWAPEYGNAVLSRFPIKQWRVQKVFDDSDFRNVMKATIEVPRVGEINFHCTHLDHLDENWRMKQINSILQHNDGPHILAGGLNALDETDYSEERWTDIVKYHKEIGKPAPKVEVMKFLKSKHYVDAKNFAGECQAVVVLAKGQNVQGTCKYGTRVDYILASPNSIYKFVPGSYEVLSSKGTSDHHIVKVDIIIDRSLSVKDKKSKQRKQRDLRKEMTKSKAFWRTNS
ncbi:hypothetical protein KFK09_011043 [Dendrobium nobile]|uniref:Endonuclease/exonuclease/phosphatase domain-containing protein n=1 Tax=Dendrobium nobile TaxID=94219 RepID=A0A8T3BEJ7_DENNO|nr:hypothetical protein KFK09_011043 [Dendrobium nobile]